MDLYLILVSPIVNEPLLSRVQCLSVLRNTGFSMLKFELYISIALYMQLVERIEEDSLLMSTILEVRKAVTVIHCIIERICRSSAATGTSIHLWSVDYVRTRRFKGVCF